MSDESHAPGKQRDTSNGASTWRVYCGAHTHVSLVSDGDQGECGTEFAFTDDDPVCPSEWVPCPKCGADCEVLRTPEYRISSGALVREPVSAEHDYVWHPSIGGRQIVECRRCGAFRSYRLVGFKPEPPKEPCYGR